MLQNDGERLRPISYISRGLSDAENKQHCNELECLALVWALETFNPYLYGKKFKVEMDNSAAEKKAEGQVWSMDSCVAGI